MTTEAYGGGAEAHQLDRVLSDSRVGIEPANAVVAENRLSRRVSLADNPTTG
jgi:hypothetical protein